MPQSQTAVIYTSQQTSILIVRRLHEGCEERKKTIIIHLYVLFVRV